MAITQTFVDTFKTEIAKGTHDFEDDTFKIALYTSSATLDASTLAYTASGEVTGAGYSAGGTTLTGGAVTFDTKGLIDFDDAVWSGSTISAAGALIYNSSKSDKAVCVMDFGGTQSSSSSTFTAAFPAVTATTSIIRIS